MMDEKFGIYDEHLDFAQEIFDTHDTDVVRYKRDSRNEWVIDEFNERIVDEVLFDGPAERIRAVDRMIQATDQKLQKFI